MTVLYHWPESGHVGRNISKERLYAEGSVSPSLRQRFIDEVRRVRWAYKLGDESIRLRGNDRVPEIQIFEIDLKGDDLSDTVLAAVDKVVPSPIYFELRRIDRTIPQVCPIAARKELGSRGVRLSDYFRGQWLPADAHREPLPPATDLERLHAQLLTALLPIRPRVGEDLASVIGRVTAIGRLERAIAALDRRLRLEAQFKRKVELQRELRARRDDLDALLNDNVATDEDAMWRS